MSDELKMLDNELRNILMRCLQQADYSDTDLSDAERRKAVRFLANYAAPAVQGPIDFEARTDSSSSWFRISGEVLDWYNRNGYQVRTLYAAPVPAIPPDAGNSLVTLLISIDRERNVYSDVQTHNNSFSDVAVGFGVIREELDRIFAESKNCPYFPSDSAASKRKIIRSAALQSSVPQDAKDAELYRGLRAMHWNDGKLTVIGAKDLPLGVQTYFGEMLDAAITAQRDARKGGQ